MNNNYVQWMTDNAQANLFVAKMFLFALFAVIAYPVLEWTPAWMRLPAKFIYLAALLGLFILTTVYSVGL